MGRLYARLDNCLSSRSQCESQKPKFFVVHAPICLKIIVSNKLSFLEHVFLLLDGSVQIKVHENVVYGFIRKRVTSFVHFKVMKNAFSESTLFNSSWLVRTPIQTMLMLSEVKNFRC